MSEPSEVIQRVRELDKAATDGPWEWLTHPGDKEQPAHHFLAVGDKEIALTAEYRDGMDLNLMGQYRTIAPRLANALEAVLALEPSDGETLLDQGYDLALDAIRQAIKDSLDGAET